MALCCAKILLLFLNLAVTNASFFSRSDCLVTLWSDWTEANEHGIQTRNRVVMRFPSGGGVPCPALNEEREIDIDCQVSQWSEWGENFGFGQQIRSRTVTQAQKGRGASCPKLEEVRYTGKEPSVIVVAKQVEKYFIRPSGKPTSISRTRREAAVGSVRDLVIIMDSSGSIGKSGFTAASSEISRLIGLLCPNGPFDKRNGEMYQHNQAAMLTFSSYVYENFDFDDYSSTAEIQNAIARAEYYGGGTNTHEAFIQAISLFQTKKGARNSSNVKREVLILTDGQSNYHYETMAAVKLLQKEADVYGLMTGHFAEYGMEELTAYVSKPVDNHLFYVKDLQDLTALVDEVQRAKSAAGQYWCAPFDLK